MNVKSHGKQEFYFQCLEEDDNTCGRKLSDLKIKWPYRPHLNRQIMKSIALVNSRSKSTNKMWLKEIVEVLWEADEMADLLPW